MPVLRSVKEVVLAISRLGPDPDGTNAIDSLRAHGYTFSPALERIIGAAKSRRRLSSEQRKAILRRSGARMEPVVLASPHPAPTVFPVPLGGYHAVIALGASVLSDTLSGLYMSRVWPLTLDLPSLGDLTVPLLRSLFTGIPDDGDIAVGALRFTAAPVIHTIAASCWPILHVPFAIELVRPSTHAVVATLSAVVRIAIGIEAVTDPQTITLFVGRIPDAPGPNAEEKLHLDVSPSSQVQFRDGAKHDAVEFLLNNLFVLWLRNNSLRFVLSPGIDNPLSSTLGLPLPHVDARAAVAGGVEAVLVGMQFGGAATDPALLTFPGFQGDENVYARSSEALVRMAVAGSYRSGALQSLVDPIAVKEGAYFKLSGADAALKPGEMELTIDGAAVDYCKFDKDLGVTITLTAKISIVYGNIRVDHDEHIAFHAWDVFLCLALAGIELLIPLWKYASIWKDISWFARVTHIGEAGVIVTNDAPFFSGVLSRIDPVPGTERIVRVAARRVEIDDDQLEAFGRVEFLADTMHKFLYVSFVDAAGAPIRGARVQAMDMDKPAPAGDDVTPPPSTPKRVTYSGAKRRVSTQSTYTPNADQVMATATTDEQGRAVFILGNLLSTAGELVTTTTTEYLDRRGGRPRRPGEDPLEPGHELPDIDVQTETEPVPEARPDLYFRITLPGGRVADTRRLPSGLLLNFAQARLGTYLAPVVFRVS